MGSHKNDVTVWQLLIIGLLIQDKCADTENFAWMLIGRTDADMWHWVVFKKIIIDWASNLGQRRPEAVNFTGAGLSQQSGLE